MKKLFLSSLIALLFSSCKEEFVINENCVTKTQINAPKELIMNKLSSIDFDVSLKEFQFINDKVGYILARKNVGSYLEVVKTTDGGLTWENLAVNISQFPINMCFKDENIGLISVQDVTGCPPPNCLNKCVVLKTENGGDSWTEIEYPNFQGVLYHLKFDNNGNLFAILRLGDASKLLKSTDNGNSWSVICDSTQIGFNLVTFSFAIYDNLLFVAGKDKQILQIDTNGTILKTIETNQNNIWDLKIVDKNTMVLSGDSKILQTKDGGISWETIYGRKGRILDFETKDRGIVIQNLSYCDSDVYQANDVFAFTSDGGKTWSKGIECTNLALNYSNTQKIESGKYIFSIGNSIYEIKVK